MTMPHERLRALVWGCELLNAIASDDSVPLLIRLRATELTPAFPSAESLDALIGQDGANAALPRAWAIAIDAAAQLFLDFQSTDAGTERTRRDTLYTLRHFPQPGEAVYISKHFTSVVKALWIGHDTFDR